MATNINQNFEKAGLGEMVCWELAPDSLLTW